jgi:predicted DsbA family dithiol-disulfide isomerase
MRVTVYYDYICPFCFLGTKRLETLEKEFPLEIESKGIEIHPEISPKGARRSKTLRLEQVAQSITEMSKEDGLEIRHPGMIANSRLSLEASEFAKTKDKFSEFHKGIYRTYFLDGENIGDRDVILKVGEDAGLQVKELEDCLNLRTMRRRVEENRQEAEKNQILGVPAFIFGGFTVHGVQSLETFRKIIGRVIEKNLISNY